MFSRIGPLVLLLAGISACSESKSNRLPAPKDPPSSSTTGTGGKPDETPEKGCPDDLEFFRTQVWEPILSTRCVVCHSSAGVASSSAMVLQSKASALEANFEVMRAVAAIKADGTPVLLSRPTATHSNGHPGGKLFEVNSTEYKTLEQFIDRVVNGKSCEDPAPAACSSVQPLAQRVRRLTRAEYDRTVKDLLGIESTWGQTFAPDVTVGVFDSDASTLVVTPLLADQMRQAAEDLATRALTESNLPCSAATADSACIDSLLDGLAARAYRRPLSTDERSSYQDMFSAIASEDGAELGLTTVIAAILQSPTFLYRSEIGEPAGDAFQLDAFETASALSYLLTGSMPDDELFEAARTGEILKEDVREAQVERLLQSSSIDPVLERFIDQWLGVERILHVPKEAAVGADLTPEIRQSLRQESHAFVAHVVHQSSGTLGELLSARYSVIDPSLLPYYSTIETTGEPVDSGIKVAFPQGERAGILSHASVLSVFARADGSSPVHRGKLVRERLFCHKMAPPPPSVMVQPPAVDPTRTTRERFEAHSTQEPCRSCHVLLDPIGFGFEHFDGIGRFRATENNLTIDATGEISSTPTSDATFDGQVELADLLANSEDVRACFVKQWIQFGEGLGPTADLSCHVNEMQSLLPEGDPVILDVLRAITRSERFLRRVPEDQTTGTAGNGGTSGAGGTSGTAGSDGAGASGGTSSAGGTGGNAGTGGSGDPPLDPGSADGVTYQINQTSSDCASVDVVNSGSTPVSWWVRFPVSNEIRDLWNASAAPDQNSDLVTFEGLDYNAVLDPGQSTNFGYCVQL